MEIGRALLAERPPVARRDRARGDAAEVGGQMLGARTLNSLKKKLEGVHTRLLSGGFLSFTVISMSNMVEVICPPGADYHHRVSNSLGPAMRLSAAMFGQRDEEEPRELAPAAPAAGAPPADKSRNVLIGALRSNVVARGGSWPLEWSKMRAGRLVCDSWPRGLPIKRSVHDYNKRQLLKLLEVRDWSMTPSSEIKEESWCQMLYQASQGLARSQHESGRRLGREVSQLLTNRATRMTEAVLGSVS